MVEIKIKSNFVNIAVLKILNYMGISWTVYQVIFLNTPPLNVFQAGVKFSFRLCQPCVTLYD